MQRRWLLPSIPISIHALREEGDGQDAVSISGLDRISIHALREEGDLHLLDGHFIGLVISIHALREEGDSTSASSNTMTADISIHALREEGDSDRWLQAVPGFGFLSTPSARRATAKTEKNISAFVSL